MKIILIRQAEEPSPPAEAKKGNVAAYRVYIGASPAGRATAEALFTLPSAPVVSPLLDDVPGTQAGLRAALAAGREARRRAGEFLDLLEKDERDSVVICGRQGMSALRSDPLGLPYSANMIASNSVVLPEPVSPVTRYRPWSNCSKGTTVVPA